MAHRLKHQVEVVHLTQPLTIVTRWKARALDGKQVPTEFATGAAGMALVVITKPNGRQECRFLTPAQLEDEFEQDEVIDEPVRHITFTLPPAHVVGEKTK